MFLSRVVKGVEIDDVARLNVDHHSNPVVRKMYRDEQPVLREDSFPSGKVAGVMSVTVEFVIVLEIGIQEGELVEGPFEQSEISIDTLVIKKLLKGGLLI